MGWDDGQNLDVSWEHRLQSTNRQTRIYADLALRILDMREKKMLRYVSI
jgi:hypothetical protein